MGDLDSSVLNKVLNLNHKITTPAKDLSPSSNGFPHQASRYNLRPRRVSNSCSSDTPPKQSNALAEAESETFKSSTIPKKNGVLEQDPSGNFLLAKNLEDSFLKEADQDQNPENIFSGVLEDRLLAGPFDHLALPNDNFVPVDICKGCEKIYVTSQASNEVAIYEDDTFMAMLKTRNQFKFQAPRNVIWINHKNKTGLSTVVVLDDLAFNIFDDKTGKHLGRFFKGSKYRGLAFYSCKETGDDFLVSLDVSKQSSQHTTLLCVFSIKESVIELKNEIPISGRDLGCKFLTVVSDCSTKCVSHKALVTAIKSKQVFEVDLKLAETKEMEFQTGATQESTFYSITAPCLVKPSGICSDKLNNIILADEGTGLVMVFTSEGKLLYSFSTQTNPVGLCIDKTKEQLYVAAWKPGCILKINLRQSFY